MVISEFNSRQDSSVKARLQSQKSETIRDQSTRDIETVEFSKTKSLFEKTAQKTNPEEEKEEKMRRAVRRLTTQKFDELQLKLLQSKIKEQEEAAKKANKTPSPIFKRKKNNDPVEKLKNAIDNFNNYTSSYKESFIINNLDVMIRERFSPKKVKLIPVYKFENNYKKKNANSKSTVNLNEEEKKQIELTSRLQLYEARMVKLYELIEKLVIESRSEDSTRIFK
jgi:hypothetical protein